MRLDGPIAELSEYLGHQTNNYAEYSGLIAALNYTLRHGFKALKVVSDSELMVKQINGQYKVSSPTLKELHERAMKLIDQLDCFEIKPCVAREESRGRSAGQSGDGSGHREQSSRRERDRCRRRRCRWYRKSMAWCATAWCSSWALRCPKERW